MRRILSRALWVTGLVYLTGCAAVATVQRSLLYYPQPASGTSLGTTERLPTQDADVLVSVRAHSGDPAVIYFGGNAESVDSQLPALVKAFPDRAIYALNYRGFSGSSGKPSEEALQADALVLFDRVFSIHPDIIVIGRSLGSGVAIRVGAKRPVTKLVLVTPYYSIEELAELHFPFLPVPLLLLDKYESWRYAPQITEPTLILVAEHDGVVPRSSTDELLVLFHPGVTSTVVIAGSDHGSITDKESYVAALAAFGAAPS